MSLRLTMVMAFTLACVLGLFGSSTARQIEPWPYDKLFKRADFVVVVKPLSVRDAEADDNAKPPEDYLVGIVTRFEVLHVVKGEYKPKKLELIHFRMKEGARIGNGPLLVSFHTKPVSLQGKSWAGVLESNYMIFLKAGKDGRFEFVSGQFDPKLSVKQLLTPLP